MIKIFKNIKYSEGPAQYRKRQSSSHGFALLFTVTLSAILLSVALGITSVAMKEVQFGTSAKDTNDAFFAADTGAECVMFNDKSTNSVFDGESHSVSCNNGSVQISGSSPWTLYVPGPNGSLTQNCAVVTVTKTGGANPTTAIVSRGHNIATGSCAATINTVERELDINY